ncbi:porin family protein [Pseudoalteromonas sp. JBTF-M23]|uniref:Porin family protein n=1 Tax=Pseudoalteromonas caenipelagi TaxID=2726988 RepID=A0A849V7Y7_9GAMM|nr:outer membrane beta-barrel protein [Pseudoalteromonas caenipelagi]NOU49336.1 porin family protein [Pseudoalteromonas caenipelagi]
MKKILTFTSTIIALSLGFSAHAESNSNWYLGLQSSAQDVSLPERDFKTIGAISGYQLNEYFSLEARYNYGVSGYSHPFYVDGLSNPKYKEDIDTQASLFINTSYPIFSTLRVYGLVGTSKSNYEITTSISYTDQAGNITTTYPHLVKLSESGFTYGVGLDYQATQSVSLFVDYQVLPDLKVSSGHSESWKSINLGIKYTF